MKICPSCTLNFEENNTEQKICFDCFKKNTGQRNIALNEIILDCDNREFGTLGIITLVNFFSEQGYKIEVYKAEGQKSPHAHIKDIPRISDLPKPQNKLYKELLIKKYIGKANNILLCPELEFIDFNLCVPNHLIAEENKPHWKYGTEKKLLGILNTDLENFCESDIYDQAIELRQEYKPIVNGSGITAQIIKAISIKDIARQFGLSLKGNKCLCPFHADGKTPSLIFYEEQGRFHCFGCNKDGNIIKFYAMLKELKADFKYKKPKEVTA